MTERSLPVWASIACVTIILCGLSMGPAANAAVVLSFAQNINGPTVTATNNVGDTSTTVVGTDIPVTISQYIGGGAPISAFLTFQLNSSGAASVSKGQLLQPYNGSFSFTSLALRGGTNFLSSVFTDFVFGIVGGSSLTLNSSQPPGSVSFTSDILNVSALDIPRALSFAFADVTPPGNIVGTTLAGFASNVAGTVSAGITSDAPEPSNFALPIVGPSAVGLVGRNRRSSRG